MKLRHDIEIYIDIGEGGEELRKQFFHVLYDLFLYCGGGHVQITDKGNNLYTYSVFGSDESFEMFGEQLKHIFETINQSRQAKKSFFKRPIVFGLYCLVLIIIVGIVGVIMRPDSILARLLGM